MREVIALVSAIIAVFAFIFTFITYFSQRRPRLVAHCEVISDNKPDATLAEKQTYQVVLMVENIGKSPAVGVELTFPDPPISGMTIYNNDSCLIIMPGKAHDVYSWYQTTWLADCNKPQEVQKISVEYQDSVYTFRKHHETLEFRLSDAQSREIDSGFSKNLEKSSLKLPRTES